MLVSSAYAQVSGGAAAGGGFEAILPLILIFVVFYFLLIRPQQKKMKQHREALGAIRRSDKVVTGGGIIGTVTKIDDEDHLTVEISKDVKVKVRRDLISSVLPKLQARSNTAQGEGRSSASGGGFLAGLFGGGQKNNSVDVPEPQKPEARQQVKREKKSTKPRVS